MKILQCLLRSVLVVISFFHIFAFGWGLRAHRIVAEVGAQLTENGNRFWARHAEQIAFLATVPDSYWKPQAGEVEQHTHWFQIDGFYSHPKYYNRFPLEYDMAVKKFSEKRVIHHGTAIWRSEQFFYKSVGNLKGQQFLAALQYAGVMAHYIGDIAQPLHVTTNYDGYYTNNPGIHKFFESDIFFGPDLELVEKDVYRRARALLRDKDYLKAFDNELKKVIFASVLRSYERVESVIKTDLRYGREELGAEKQMEIAKNRMADGAATYALLLSRIWREAGEPQVPSKIFEVPVPDWIKPEYR